MAMFVYSAIVFSNLILVINSFLIPDGLQGVHTRYGEIIGHLNNVQFDGRTYQVQKFLGIPYAEPPIGKLRFKKPLPITHLSTPFVANSFSPQCPQITTAVLTAKPQSEDCLFLNIYVPVQGQKGSSPKPVMVWIHGGGFYVGSANIYEADVLSTYTDVIVVTFNYRLGPLGFFSTHDQNAYGNYGVWDQHMAIMWVKENIASFGGDNANITIFGESAGASSVIYQMLYPGNKGLFHRAIAQSGTVAAWAVTDKNMHYKRSLEFADSLGCNDTANSNIMLCLRNKSSAEIERAVAKNLDDHPFDDVHPYWVPVYDGDFVIAEPTDILAEVSNTNVSSKYAHFHETDLMIGANNQDGIVYIGIWMALLNISTDAFLPGNAIQFHISDLDFENVLIPRATEGSLHQIPSTLVNKAVKLVYTNWEEPSNDTLTFLRIVDLVTDYALNAPMITTANAHVAKNPNTFVYQFSTAPPIRKFLPNVAYHGDDLMFVFGMNLPMQQVFNFTMADVTQEQLRVSKTMMTMWSNFAKSGNPNKPTNVRALFDLEWLDYGVSQRYLEITPEMTQESVKTRISARGVELWNVLLPMLQSF